MIPRKEKISILFFFAANIILAQLMNRMPIIATLHAWGTLALALIWAVSGRLPRTAMICAYMTGCEVLWRMNKAAILWEFGKYAVCLVMLMSFAKKAPKRPLLPWLYFLMLVPSVFITKVEFENFEAFRQQISFNLSGPLVLTISVLFWSRINLTKEEFHKMIIMLVGPIVGIASIAAYKIHTATDLVFGTASNKLASGGFSANQVSSMLGLGVLLLFFYLMGQKKGKSKIVIFAFMIWLAIQAALTLSRGGLYGAVIGILAGSLFLIGSGKTRGKFIFALLLMGAIYQFIAVPYLNKFTGGAVSARFQKTTMTGREELMDIDMQLWKDNPLFGVGAGQSIYFHTLGEHAGIAAHTEFTRLLAEHGSFGLLAILMLILMAISFFRRARNAPNKAFAVAIICWVFSYMVTAAMRIMAPSFIFGLGAVTLLPEQPPFYPKFYPKPPPHPLPETPFVPPVRP